MTEDQFIVKEIATWGEDYIFALIDRGYEARCLISRSGEMKWTWVQPVKTHAEDKSLTFG